MKNLLFTTALLLAASFTFGQNIQKGNLIGIHIITVELKPGVTMEQVIDYYNTKYLPAHAKYFVGVKGFIGKGVRGSSDTANKLALIWHINNEADRDKFFNMKEGGMDLNELGQKAWAQFTPVYDGLAQLATIKEEWADWLIK